MAAPKFWEAGFWVKGFWAENFWVGENSSDLGLGGGYAAENISSAQRQRKKRDKKRLADLYRELYDDSIDF